MYINSLKLESIMMAFTETWLNENKQDMYNMPNYNCVNRFRKQRRGEGLSLYIRNDIKFMNRLDLKYFDGDNGSLFIEIDKNVFNAASHIVGVIHRMPNTRMAIFNNRRSDIMNIVQRERKNLLCSTEFKPVETWKSFVNKSMSWCLKFIQCVFINY